VNFVWIDECSRRLNRSQILKFEKLPALDADSKILELERCRRQSRIKAQLALRHIMMSGMKMRIFSAQKKKKLYLATENILHNILEKPIFLTVILIGSLHMPS